MHNDINLYPLDTVYHYHFNKIVQIYRCR